MAPSRWCQAVPEEEDVKDTFSAQAEASCGSAGVTPGSNSKFERERLACSPTFHGRVPYFFELHRNCKEVWRQCGGEMVARLPDMLGERPSWHSPTE